MNARGVSKYSDCLLYDMKMNENPLAILDNYVIVVVTQNIKDFIKNLPRFYLMSSAIVDLTLSDQTRNCHVDRLAQR